LFAFFGMRAREIDRTIEEKSRIEQEKSQIEEEKTRIEEEKLMVEERLKESMHSSQAKFKMICLQCNREYDDGATHCLDDYSELARVAANLVPGSTFANRYQIICLLGSGGVSTVYKAKHLFLDKHVAIKLLHAHQASNVKSIQRFQQEARATSQLAHPNLMQVQDFGVTDAGQPYLVMDYLEGVSLSTLLDNEGRLPIERALPLFLQICDGLIHAHGVGIIHRDLKPSNVMLIEDKDGSDLAKIVDFGFAKRVTQDETQKLTQTGEVFGSPVYMSPEQCRGEKVDELTDIYAMGCLMYEVLSGNPPFLGESIYQTFSMHVCNPPPPFGSHLGIPAWLEKIVTQALGKERKERQQSALELRKGLWLGYQQMTGIAVLD